MAGGRPSIPFNQEIADRLCEALSTSNKSTSTILKDLGKDGDTVGLTTIFKWLNDNEEFAKQYARGKEEQADFLAEEMIDIADDSSLDVAFNDEGKPFIYHEHINRSKLRVDTRKWIASKLKPKKYGDRITQDVNINEDLNSLTEAQLLSKIDLFQKKLGIVVLPSAEKEG
jgi:hypothetical protein